MTAKNISRQRLAFDEALKTIAASRTAEQKELIEKGQRGMARLKARKKIKDAAMYAAEVCCPNCGFDLLEGFTEEE